MGAQAHPFPLRQCSRLQMPTSHVSCVPSLPHGCCRQLPCWHSTYTSGAVLGKALGGSSHAHKCRDHAPYSAHARSAAAMRMLIDIVGVVVIERARVIGARQFSAICFGTTERVYNAS